MSPHDDRVDARLRHEGALLRETAAAAAPTDEAWAQIAAGAPARPPLRRPDRRWPIVALAGGLVAAALVGIVVVQTRDRDSAPVGETPSTTAAPFTTPTLLAPSTSAAPTVTSEPAVTTIPVPATVATTETSTTRPPDTIAGTPATTSPNAAAPILTDLPTGSGDLSSIAAVSTNEAWALVNAADGTATIYHGSTSDCSTCEAPGWLPHPLPADVSAGLGGIVSVVADATGDVWLLGTTGVAATHDDGTTWHLVALPGATSGAEAGAAGNGFVHLVAFTDNGFGIFTAPVGSDAFTLSPYVLPAGAAPIADFQLALQRDTGFLVYNGRGITGAAHLVGGQWQQWDAPCPTATATDGATGGDQSGNTALDASPTSSEVVAVCTDNPFVTGTGALNPLVLVSHDGGSTFTPTDSQPAVADGDQLAGVLVSADATLHLWTTSATGAATELVSPDGRGWVPAPTAEGGTAAAAGRTIVGRLADGSGAFVLAVDPSTGRHSLSDMPA